MGAKNYVTFISKKKLSNQEINDARKCLKIVEGQDLGTKSCRNMLISSRRQWLSLSNRQLHIPGAPLADSHRPSLQHSVLWRWRQQYLFLLTSHGPHFLPLLLSLGLSVHLDVKTGKQKLEDLKKRGKARWSIDPVDKERHAGKTEEQRCSMWRRLKFGTKYSMETVTRVKQTGASHSSSLRSQKRP